MSSTNDDFLIDGRSASDLRVVDLKELLEKRCLSKSGSKSVLLQRLKESLSAQKKQEEPSVAEKDPNFVPNMEMKSCGSNIVTQYLEKQQQALLAAKKAAQQTRAANDDNRSSSASSTTQEPILNNGSQKSVIDEPIVEKHEHSLDTSKTSEHDEAGQLDSKVPQETDKEEKDTVNSDVAENEINVPLEATVIPHIEKENIEVFMVSTDDSNPEEAVATKEDNPASAESSQDTEADINQKSESASVSASPKSTPAPEVELAADDSHDDRSMASDDKNDGANSDSQQDENVRNGEDVQSSSPPQGESEIIEEETFLKNDSSSVANEFSRDDVIRLPLSEDYQMPFIGRLLPGGSVDDDDKNDDSLHSTEAAAPIRKPQKKRRWGSTTVGKRTTMSISSDSLKEIVGNVKTTDVALLELDTTIDEQEEQLDYDEEPAPKRIVIPRDNGDNEDGMEAAQQTTTEEEPPLKKGENKRIKLEEPTEAFGEEFVRIRSPSPARRPVSRIIHVHGLTRPFNFKSWLEFLSSFGNFVMQDDFWIDNIKSHCLVRYSTTEEAGHAREQLDNIKWPKFNSSVLRVEYATDDDLERFKRTTKENERPGFRTVTSNGKSSFPDNQTIRQRTVREITSNEIGSGKKSPKQDEKIDNKLWPKSREWDKGKADWRGERSPPRIEKRERIKVESSPVQKRIEAQDKIAPVKLLEDLFKKTKTAPFIYWLPLSQEQINEKQKQKVKRDFDRNAERHNKRPSPVGDEKGRNASNRRVPPKRDFDFDPRDSSNRHDRQRRR